MTDDLDEAQIVTVGMHLLQLSEVEQEAQKGLTSAVGGPAGSLLDSCPADLWPRLRRLLASSVSKARQVRPAQLTASPQRPQILSGPSIAAGPMF